MAVADAGGLNGAARALGLSVPTVSRALRRLEGRLGAALFHRTSRRLSLTALGDEALPAARALLAEAEALEERLAEARGAPGGLVRLAAPLDFGRAHVAPLLPGFLARWPDIRIALDLDDRRHDIVASGHDIVLRIGRLSDSSLIARRLCAVRLLTVAAPSLFERVARPRHPADLEGLPVLRYANADRPSQFAFEGPGGASWTVTVDGPLIANNGGALLPALLAARGVGVLPDFLVAGHLATGAIEQVLPDWRPPDLALWLVTPPSPLRPRRVQLLMDYLAEGFARPPWATP
ncbi:MAG: LysR family transcriptional regulator [Sphingomonadaceae bacterium]